MTKFIHTLVFRDGTTKDTLSFCTTEEIAKELVAKWNASIMEIYEAGRIDHLYSYRAK